jgi:hypothetical protein
MESWVFPQALAGKESGLHPIVGRSLWRYRTGMKPIRTFGTSNVRTLCDILLVVIGLNMLVVLAIAQPGGGTEALVGAVGVAMALIGGYFTVREVIWHS